MQEVYKVAKALKDGRLVSLYAHSPEIRLYYKIGKTTFPKVGKILAFSTLKYAISFAKGCSIGNINLQILKAKTPSYELQVECLSLLPFLTYKRCLNFWTNIVAGLIIAPQGTVACLELTPTEEVKWDRLKS